MFFVHNNVHELNIVLLVFSDYANIMYENRTVDEVGVRIGTRKNGYVVHGYNSRVVTCSRVFNISKVRNLLFLFIVFVIVFQHVF